MKITTKYVRKIIRKNKGCVKKNFEYIDSKTSFDIRCYKGHIFETTWNRIQQGHWCPYCEKLKVNEENVRELVRNKGGTLCKNWVYKNIKDKFKVRCSEGHIFKTCWNYIQQGNWCPYCGIMNQKRKMTKNEKVIRSFIKRKGGTLKKTWAYKNNKEKFWVKCKHKHIWKTTWNNIQQGKWCPYCTNNYQENSFRKIIEKYFDASFLSKRPTWLRDFKTNYPLELDGYNKELKIAFEYQGEQHYELHWLNQFSENKLKIIQERDRFKIDKCKEKGILLIVVPYKIPKNKWKKLIKKFTDKSGELP